MNTWARRMTEDTVSHSAITEPVGWPGDKGETYIPPPPRPIPSKPIRWALIIFTTIGVVGFFLLMDKASEYACRQNPRVTPATTRVVMERLPLSGLEVPITHIVKPAQTEKCEGWW